MKGTLPSFCERSASLAISAAALAQKSQMYPLVPFMSMLTWDLGLPQKLQVGSFVFSIFFAIYSLFFLFICDGALLRRSCRSLWLLGLSSSSRGRSRAILCRSRCGNGRL